MPDELNRTPSLPDAIGRYQVARLIGEGAMGRVLLAHDPVLDRDVAVKHLRADLSIPDDVRRGLVTRMRHEARAAARVMHPHLVTLHDMGEDDRVGLYLVFEYVEGPTLKQRSAEGPMPAHEAAKLAEELGSALTTAHAAGILHRDIKPENVILSKKGSKVADFGIAKIPDSTLTHQGGLMGTPAYSAPETFRTSTFSPESDQFSLAATLYEAVSGERAFPGDDAVAVAQRILHEAPEPFAARLGLSAAVDEVFARALSRKPRSRFPSCEDFGRALAAALRPAPSPTEGNGTSHGTDLQSPSKKGVASLSSGPPSARAPRAANAVGGATATDNDVPSERKNSHVILGIIAVLITGVLLARAAMKSAEDATAAPTAGSAVLAPPPSASAPRPRPPVRPVPKPTLTATASVAAGAPSPSASAPPPDPSVSGTSSAEPAGTTTAAPSPDAGL
ncbi:MAG: serine/threonine protein kinase [Polyangiaceae bacterium]|nr:serine/threonine protein kinase [Polyangiaceae bacterium]